MPARNMKRNSHWMILIVAAAAALMASWLPSLTGNPAACSGHQAELRRSSGIFGINEYEYNNNMDCNWQILVETNKRVQLHFVSFGIEANSDCVSIYDNRDRWNDYNAISWTKRLQVTFCGGSLPGDVTSGGNIVFVNFKTGRGATNSGFSIYYTAFSPVDGCFDSPAEIRGDVGTFGISDKHTFNYMPCTWKIQVEPTKLVQLHFLSFDLVASTDCSTASVKIYDGTDTSAPLLHSFCGNSLPDDVTSSGNTVLVHFMHFKHNSANTYEGFTIYYSLFIPVEGCFDSPAEMGGDMGTFGISDDQTLSYMTCSWKIQVEPSKLVQLHFLSFDLVASTDCSTASVKIYDGNDTSAPLLHSFCEDSLPCDVTSSGNTALVHFMHFKQNSANTYEGFKIYYSMFTPVEGCAASPVEMKGSKGTLSISDDQYHNDMRCGWNIQVEPSKLVQLHFLSFDLVASTNCSTASVKIYDGNDTSAPLLRSFCGNSLPGDVISSGNSALVYFKTDCSNTSGCFSAYYSAFTPVEGCSDSPVELGGSKGTFGVSDDQYHNNMRGSWKIQVEPSKRVRLHFLIFELEDCSDCACDSVDIADVDGRTTPVMSSFCGSTIPKDIFTVNNRVFVYFRTDGFTTGSGFRIYYSTIFPIQGCHGSPATKKGPKGTIGINETNYDNYMTCGWKIQVEATKRVQLHFLSFKLETSTDCSFDNVTIYDGHDTSAPLLQTSCGYSLPDNVASSGNTMFVRFKTDHSGTYGGFNIYYSAFIPVDGCLGTPVEMRGSKGTFGISDDQYHNDMRCSWKIQVDPFKRVRLHFLSFHLQESTDCSYDSIKVYDGKDTTASLMRTVCGTTIPEDITSSTHTLFVHFSSGDTSTYSAFQIYYSDLVVPGGCRGNAITMRGPSGNIGVTQVQYTNYMRCNWNIQVDSTDIVKLGFVEFSVESCCDSVTVYDGDSRSAPLLGTFRGNTLPRNVFSTNNTMLVYFESDGSGTWNGFEINYTTLPLATVCPDGMEVGAAGSCRKCSHGKYRRHGVEQRCTQCPSGWSTPTEMSVTVLNCTVLCPDGMEVGAGGLCLKCSHGKYRRHGVEQRCTQCPSGWTTPNEMSVTVLNCTVPDCQPGEMNDGQTCTKCPRGTYQPDRWMTACVDCPLNHTTLGVGSINIKDCKWLCQPGFRLDEVTGQCVVIPRGVSKNKALHIVVTPCPSHVITPRGETASTFNCCQENCTIGQRIVGTTCEKCPVGTYQDKICQTMCIPCGDNMTTLRQGATSITDCMHDCQLGEMNDGQLCTKCPRGTYQPYHWMTACTDCPLNFSTRDIGSISIADCKWQCESGFQLDEVRDECVLCPRGFFREKGRHFDCQSCPKHLTTPGRGSSSASGCSQGNCTTGQRIVGTTCEECSVGTYQDKMWQIMCLPCGDNMTTLREGATSITECMADCQPGEMGDGRLCTKCPRGTYQPGSRMTACIDCPLNFTTRNVGSANIVDCKYKCDYCPNCGLCKEIVSESPLCLCTSSYEDNKCNYTRSADDAAAAVVTADLQSDVPITTTIIGACFGGFALLLVSVAGCALCYRRRRRHSGSETAPITTRQQEVGECTETCQVHDTGV